MALSKKWKRYRGWIAVAVILVVAGVAFYILRGSQESAAGPSYQTETAQKGTLSVTVDGTGNLAVRDEVDANSSVSGEVAKVYVESGDEVEKGDVLFKLSSTSVASTVSSAKAAKKQASSSLQKANLDLYQAEQDLKKLKKESKAETSTVSSSDIKIAKKQVSIAEANVSAAELSYESASDDYDDAVDELNDLEVTAPCDGIVWTVNIEKGDYVTGESDSSSSSSAGVSGSSSSSGSTSSSSSSAPVTIARDGKMGVELTINEVDVSSLEDGQEAQLSFDAVSDLTTMTATVDEISTDGTVDSGVVTYSVWVTLNGTDSRLKPGMSATATIVTQVARNAILVSNSAVQTAEDGSSYVQVLKSGSTTPEDVTVTTGISSATQTVITSGVSEGDTVVTGTVTSSSDDSSSDSSDSEDDNSSGGGMMMMGGSSGGGGGMGGPPSGGGGPGGQ